MATVGDLVVILAADVVGYPSLIEADQESTLERLEGCRRQFVYPKIAEHNGRIVRATGGSLLVEFASSPEAVRCAVEVQQGMYERNIGVAPDQRITFCVGVNIGAATGDDLVSRAVAALPIDQLTNLVKPGIAIYGDSSRIAVSIAALAEPGGVCVSGAVWDDIRDQLPYTFDDLGKRNLDIGAGPVHCYVMRPPVSAGPRVAAQDDVRPPASGTSFLRLHTTQRVALTAAVVFTIAVSIAGSWSFLDSSRHPLSTPKAFVTNKPATVAQPAQPAPPKVAATDPRQPPEAQSPAKSQSPMTSPAVGQPLVSAATTPSVVDSDELADAAARELIVQGSGLYQLPYTLARWQEARRDFERALELDSRSREARIGLAAVLSTKLADGWSPVLQEDIPRAEQLLAEALDTGGVSNQAAARFTLGVLRQMQNRLLDAQKEFETAISLDSNTPEPISTLVRRYCTSANPRPASRHWRRRSNSLPMLPI